MAKVSYQPGIDGLRAVALLAIFVVHADMGLASGAFLAVSTFFTLSGFLITSLLVIEHGNHDRIDLRSFWARRARRLLPASLVAIVVIGLATIVLGDANQVTNLPGDVISALAYFANWHYIIEGTTYGARFGGESPLLHFWSLAIEEQFYLVFPLICAAGLALGRRWRNGLAIVLGAGIAASLASGVIGSLGDADVDRLYFGTDVRSAELLVGALVAVWWVPRRERLSAATHRGFRVAGIGLIVLMLGLIAVARSDDMFWYRGGLIAYSLVTAGVVLAAVEDGGPIRRLLSSRLLVTIGVVSYGAYLFHWPIFVWLRSETGLSGWQRLVVGTVAAMALAVLSHRLIEEPVRTGRRYRPRVLVPVGVGLACAAIVVGVAAPRLSSADDEVTLDEALAEFDEHIEVRAAPEGRAPNIGVVRRLDRAGVRPVDGAVGQHARRHPGRAGLGDARVLDHEPGRPCTTATAPPTARRPTATPGRPTGPARRRTARSTSPTCSSGRGRSTRWTPTARPGAASSATRRSTPSSSRTWRPASSRCCRTRGSSPSPRARTSRSTGSTADRPTRRRPRATPTAWTG